MLTANQNPDLISYTFNDHKHRYAVWTAAKAVQHSFTTTKNILAAIEATSLREFSESIEDVSARAFDVLNKESCTSIINYLHPIARCSYGRATKIVAIYLKTSVIISRGELSKNSEVIHPPVDSILLTSLPCIADLTLATERSTKFDETNYWNVVSLLPNYFGFFNWRLEAFWQPEQDSKENIIEGLLLPKEN